MLAYQLGVHLSGGGVCSGALESSGDHVDAEVDAVHKHAVLGRHVEVPAACAPSQPGFQGVVM